MEWRRAKVKFREQKVKICLNLENLSQKLQPEKHSVCEKPDFVSKRPKSGQEGL